MFHLAEITIPLDAAENLPTELMACRFEGLIFWGKTGCVYDAFLTDFILGWLLWWVVVLFIWLLVRELKTIR